MLMMGSAHTINIDSVLFVLDEILPLLRAQGLPPDEVVLHVIGLSLSIPPSLPPSLPLSLAHARTLSLSVSLPPNDVLHVMVEPERRRDTDRDREREKECGGGGRHKGRR